MTKLDQQLAALYQSIDERGRQQLNAQQITGDPILAIHEPDQRRGLTLLVTLPAHVKRNIQFCLTSLRSAAPNMYYYPSTDLHITILDLLRAQKDFQLSPAQFSQYQRVISQVIAQARPVQWTIKNVYLSPVGVLVGGFYSPVLTTIRDQIRRQCQQQGLPVMERYRTVSGHMTVARFIKQPTNPQKLLKAVDQLAQLKFGTFTSYQFSLVVHDWYNQRIDQAAPLPIGQGA
ncbi:2'-5' RNA ligase family protein [Limosilactobacillus frumenti]|nr:2'-5' RNA ligase family protein [Limosilactobacillus frumenti]MBA2913364.1 hypothetical protein [Limosilactobacillus frumenti]QFG72751.1 hypothetical protein LF145_05110 [Limosilactobacillus frumenti]